MKRSYIYELEVIVATTRQKINMTVKVIKVKKEDTAIINFIIENIIDNSDEKPTTNHLEKLLSDDRTYLLAAVFEDNVVGYALVYSFLLYMHRTI